MVPSTTKTTESLPAVNNRVRSFLVGLFLGLLVVLYPLKGPTAPFRHYSKIKINIYSFLSIPVKAHNVYIVPLSVGKFVLGVTSKGQIQYPFQLSLSSPYFLFIMSSSNLSNCSNCGNSQEFPWDLHSQCFKCRSCRALDWDSGCEECAQFSDDYWLNLKRSLQRFSGEVEAEEAMDTDTQVIGKPGVLQALSPSGLGQQASQILPVSLQGSAKTAGLDKGKPAATKSSGSLSKVSAYDEEARSLAGQSQLLPPSINLAWQQEQDNQSKTNILQASARMMAEFGSLFAAGRYGKVLPQGGVLQSQLPDDSRGIPWDIEKQLGTRAQGGLAAGYASRQPAKDERERGRRRTRSRSRSSSSNRGHSRTRPRQIKHGRRNVSSSSFSDSSPSYHGKKDRKRAKRRKKYRSRSKSRSHTPSEKRRSRRYEYSAHRKPKNFQDFYGQDPYLRGLPTGNDWFNTMPYPKGTGTQGIPKEPSAALGTPYQGINPFIYQQPLATEPSGAEIQSTIEQQCKIFFQKMFADNKDLKPVSKTRDTPSSREMPDLTKEVISQEESEGEQEPEVESVKCSDEPSGSDSENSGLDEEVKQAHSDGPDYNLRKHLFPLALSLNPEIAQESKSPTREMPKALAYAGIKSTSKDVDALPFGAVTKSMLNKADLILGGFYNPKRRTWEHQVRSLPPSGAVMQRPYAGNHLALHTKGSFFKGPPKDIVSPINFRTYDFKSVPDDRIVGLASVDAFTPELAQNHQVEELSFVKDPNTHLSPANMDSWESIARCTVQSLSKVEILTTAAINALDQLTKANEAYPQEDLVKLRALLAGSFGALTNAQAFAITTLSNNILHRRDMWISKLGEESVKQLRIAPLFGSTLFSSDLVNRVRQEYVDSHQKNLVVTVSTDTAKPNSSYRIPKATKPKKEKKQTPVLAKAAPVANSNPPKSSKKTKKNKGSSQSKPPKGNP